MTTNFKLIIILVVFCAFLGVTDVNAQSYYDSGCTYHAYKLCVGNNIYWYSGCNQQQDLYSTCTNGLVCQYGQCTNYTPAPNPNPGPNPTPYQPYSTIACYNNSIYWHDSLGVVSGLYKSCSDGNTCSTDTCSGNICINTTKCDGTTCAQNSSDYNKYCQTTPQNNCGNNSCQASLGETNATCPADCPADNSQNLTISFFAKIDTNSNQWLESVQANSNSKIYFMLSTSNTSANLIEDANISVTIPGQLTNIGDLKVNGTSFAGNIESGIIIDSIAPNTTYAITFEGTTKELSENFSGQAVALSSVSGITKNDSVNISIQAYQPDQSPASISSSEKPAGFWAFLKRWYLWILGGVVLVFLFIIVYKRFSSEA